MLLANWEGYLSLLLSGEVAVGMEFDQAFFSCGVVGQLDVSGLCVCGCVHMYINNSKTLYMLLKKYSVLQL